MAARPQPNKATARAVAFALRARRHIAATFGADDRVVA